MNARKRAILNAIERGPITAEALAVLTGAPQASVRRLVQSLRNDGHNIAYAYPETGGVYEILPVSEVINDGDAAAGDDAFFGNL